jgi:endoglucanase
MNSESKKFLFDLLKTPSPVGFEEKIQRVVKKRMESYADTMSSDVHGNLIVGINTKAKRRVMLAGHCDQIGFMVRHISEKGFIYLEALGGIDTTVLPGSTITLYGKKGVVHGVIGHTPIHLQPVEKRGKLDVRMSNVWVDIGAKDKKDAEKRLEIGDYAVFTPSVTELENDIIVGPGLDNRVGLFVVMEALRLCARGKLNVAVYAVSTVQEEVGLRGAITSTYAINPHVGIAVDVTHATDNPAIADAKQPPCILGKGPVVVKGPNANSVVIKRLEAAAKAGKIPQQPGISGRLFGNDANTMQISREGVAAASIGIPNRYMHTQVEACNLKDLENAAKLLARFIKDIKESTDFRPK